MSTAAPSSSSRPQSENSRSSMIQKFIDALLEKGFLHENFNLMRNLPENQNSLVTFCGDAEPKLKSIESALASEPADFDSVINDVEMIKSGAERVGGVGVASACTYLQQHCNDNNIERSNEAFKKLKWEYYVLRDCFHHILRAEKAAV